MDLLVGTDDGLYGFEVDAAAEPEPLVEGVEVRQVRSGPNGSTVYAATMSGLFASSDAGESWTDLGLPEDGVASVFESPDGRYLFAGTQPASLYRSGDGGESWTRSESFDALPGKDEWAQLGPGGPQVRDLTAHPRAPGKLFAGVEAVGVYVSPDYGDSWEFRSYGLHRDPHGLETLAQDTLLATCGRGVYRTSNAGRSWQRVDTHRRHFWYSYFREAVRDETRGTVYTSGEDRAETRFEDDGRGVILESTDGGKNWEHREFPGCDGDYVNAWASRDGLVVGGTVSGRLLEGPDDWELAGRMDDTVRSLELLR